MFTTFYAQKEKENSEHDFPGFRGEKRAKMLPAIFESQQTDELILLFLFSGHAFIHLSFLIPEPRHRYLPWHWEISVIHATPGFPDQRLSKAIYLNQALEEEEEEEADGEKYHPQWSREKERRKSVASSWYLRIFVPVCVCI